MEHDGRYAPSPTGRLHLGNLRTALAAWLVARHHGAAFRLRIDDLDPQRARPEHEALQRADLAALGLDFDGPATRTTEHAADHADALAQLEAAGLTYPCWCTRQEVREAASAAHGSLRDGAYPGTCRDLTARERAARSATGRPPAVRVDARRARVAFVDEVAGPREGVVDDLVVRRNDGAVAYNLAIVVDDHVEGICEIVRGADLLDSTPGQLWLHDALGLGPHPRHAHVGLVVGPDGERLAKRHGSVTLEGKDPASVRDALAATLGLCEPGDRLSLRELLGRFAPAALTADPTRLALQAESAAR